MISCDRLGPPPGIQEGVKMTACTAASLARRLCRVRNAVHEFSSYRPKASTINSRRRALAGSSGLISLQIL